jgi:hypothetical protein
MLWLSSWKTTEKKKSALVIMPRIQCCWELQLGCCAANCVPSVYVINAKIINQLGCR